MDVAFGKYKMFPKATIIKGVDRRLFKGIESPAGYMRHFESAVIRGAQMLHP